MKTMYIRESGQVELTDVEKPVRKKDEVLLKLLYGGICGDDPGPYKGTFVYFDYPRTPGHKSSAEIIEADENNKQGLRPGMTVTCNPYFNRGYCYSYKNGVVNACMDSQTMECQHDGAFQEYITVPSERVYNGKGIDPMLLAVTGPFCISYHGVSRAKMGIGGKALVIEAGTTGALAVVAAKAEGALVYISDISEGKLGTTKAPGVDGTILNDSPENFEKAVNDATGGNGFDTAIRIVGLPSTFQNCIDVACFGGKVVVIGVRKKNLDFSFTLLQKEESNVLGLRNVLEKDFVKLTGLVRSGETSTENIITNVYKFENGARAFYDFVYNPEDMLKVVIDFTGD